MQQCLVYVYLARNCFASTKLFHQDNAQCHKSFEITAKLHKLHYNLLLHPPYSLDLAPSDYCRLIKKKARYERHWL